MVGLAEGGGAVGSVGGVEEPKEAVVFSNVSLQIANDQTITPLPAIAMHLFSCSIQMATQMHQILPRIQFLALLDILSIDVTKVRGALRVVVVVFVSVVVLGGMG